MILECVAGDTVNPIHPVIPRVENRRDGSRRQRRFPDVPEDEDDDSDEPAPEVERKDSETPPDSGPRDDEGRKIDVRVSGRFVPTGQILPGRGAALRLH
jgi:hypothetical protein